MSSQTVPSDGGGGAGQSTPGKQTTLDVARQPGQFTQQHQQQLPKAGHGEETGEGQGHRTACAPPSIYYPAPAAPTV